MAKRETRFEMEGELDGRQFHVFVWGNGRAPWNFSLTASGHIINGSETSYDRLMRAIRRIVRNS